VGLLLRRPRACGGFAKNGSAGCEIPVGRVPTSLNRQLFDDAIDGNAEINRAVNLGVTMLLFEEKSKPKLFEIINNCFLTVSKLAIANVPELR
jgi:hypothetical protein